MRNADTGHRMRGGVAAAIASALATVALVVTFVAAGLAVCAAPPTTELLSRATCTADISPFSQEELVRAAVATREYTVGSNNRDAVFTVIADINRTANTPYAQSPQAVLYALPDAYTLTDDALGHLDDVHGVVSAATGVLAGIAAVALACCIIAGATGGRRRLGGVLMRAGGMVLALFAVLAAWAVIDFDGFFAAFHSLFFAQGSWVFSSESLLICMYPTAFWVGMGATWLATAVLLSILSVILGRRLRR